MKKNEFKEKVKGLLFGTAVGDALGVPVEFKSREYLKTNPVKDMISGGVHNQAAGTWSDDSSLTFCLAESLIKGFSPKDVADKFVKSVYEGYWTANGRFFDLGYATGVAIKKLKSGVSPLKSGAKTEDSNGNGSLMRISPLVFYIYKEPILDRYKKTKIISSITHAHMRSVISCFYYIEFLRGILLGEEKFETYSRLKKEIPSFLSSLKVKNKEIEIFDKLLSGDIYKLKESDISSSGYVLHTLEASVWCFMTTDNFKNAVLKAVNLGEDTDSVGAVSGAMAGLYYGFSSIPKKWTKKLARYGDIIKLSDSFYIFLK
ncbi:MAG TPA: ADP-ribosylglycohydrolase family protein [Elusimicrobiales bacterium]|nr:ADP-ribosylglycohydrolase family protein [Elusimicrobiales bacterium]HOL62966.1 ADP-ribosylglycohydrolase family protein [Elusimicrobiales bacterium]HPO95912.1 ADP-ribosylglycohydrolase family protein [Elusimicrobiales bacterium]